MKLNTHISLLSSFYAAKATTGLVKLGTRLQRLCEGGEVRECLAADHAMAQNAHVWARLTRHMHITWTCHAAYAAFPGFCSGSTTTQCIQAKTNMDWEKENCHANDCFFLLRVPKFENKLLLIKFWPRIIRMENQTTRMIAPQLLYSSWMCRSLSKWCIHRPEDTAKLRANQALRISQNLSENVWQLFGTQWGAASCSGGLEGAFWGKYSDMI